jgi:hypothetical protein
MNRYEWTGHSYSEFAFGFKARDAILSLRGGVSANGSSKADPKPLIVVDGVRSRTGPDTEAA